MWYPEFSPEEIERIDRQTVLAEAWVARQEAAEELRLCMYLQSDLEQGPGGYGKDIEREMIREDIERARAQLEQAEYDEADLKGEYGMYHYEEL